MDNKRRRLFLRLDDGSLIGREADLGLQPGSSRVVRCSVERLAEQGRAGEREIQRVQSLLHRLQNQYGVAVPEPAPLMMSAPSKKGLDNLQGAAPWATKCMNILNNIYRQLGDHKPAFHQPVDPKMLPDYYKLVKNPIFLSQIEDKLRRGVYQQPHDFANDVRLLWQNVKLYNPVGDFYRKLGDKTEEVFEQLWAATGFCTERTKRATAGLAAQKFEPEKFDAPAKPKQTRSNQGANKRPARASNRPPGLDAQGGLTPARKKQIADFLSDLPEEHTNDFMGLLPPEMLAGVESGELELDFDNLDEPTLLKIDKWLRGIRPDLDAALPPAPASPTHASGNPSVRVDSYDDEDYAEDSDEDSD